MESTKRKDWFAVAVKRDDDVTIRRIMKGSGGHYAKAIFYFLPTNRLNRCTAIVTGAVNLGDRKGIRIPCLYAT